MTSTRIANRQRRINGLPSALRRPWHQRLLRSPLFWMTLVLVPAYYYFLYAQYWLLAPEQVFEDGSRTLGIDDEAFRLGAFWAMWTALAWVVLFVWLDRFRASSPVTWLLTFGWGACASTWISIHVNSWAAQMMSTTEADADSGSRAAVFSAPFIEELSKATILVLLVILWRNKMVSRLSMVALSGLSAIGFAFVENIIYYSRVWMQATIDPAIANPEKTLLELVMLRGVYTSFGHPLFTMMTGAGLTIGLSARSKLVRVLAPVGGFMLAAAGHMLFNGMASTNSQENLLVPWYFALALVGVITVSLIVSVVGNGQLIKQRLFDYQRAGWLSQRDVEVFGGPLRRIKLIWFALWRGPKTLYHTLVLIRRITELAYLRNQMTRGVVADAGDQRARDLLVEISERRDKGLSEYRGLSLVPPRRKRGKRLPEVSAPGASLTTYPAPTAPGPAGVGGNWPTR